MSSTDQDKKPEKFLTWWNRIVSMEKHERTMSPRELLDVCVSDPDYYLDMYFGILEREIDLHVEAQINASDDPSFKQWISDKRVELVAEIVGIKQKCKDFAIHAALFAEVKDWLNHLDTVRAQKGSLFVCLNSDF